jgi:hypothetical protein
MFLFMMAAGSGLVFFGDKAENKNQVIKVYDLGITDKKYSLMLQRSKQQMEMFKMRGLHLPNMNIQKETIQAGVTKLLSEHSTQSLKLHISSDHVSEEVQKNLQHLPPYFFDEKGMLNQDLFLKAIAPLSMQDFVEEIENDAKTKVFNTLVEASLYIPKFEQELEYNGQFADKTYSYFTLSYQKFLSKIRSENPTDSVLLKYYKRPEVIEKFKTAERRSGKKWVFSQKDFIQKISESEAKSYYDKNKASLYVVTPAQMQVRQLLVTIEPGRESEARTRIQEIKEQADKEPSKFEELIKKFSDDKATASKGGLSALFSRDDKKIDKVICDTAFEFLAADGQISAPIKTERGYELIQRVKKVAASYKDFGAVSNEIKDKLGAEKFKKRFAQDASRVIANAKYKPELLQEFIKKYQGELEDLSLSARKPGIDSTQLFRMEQGRYTQYFDKNEGVILFCEAIEKSVTPSLEAVKAKILPLYFEDTAKKMAQDSINRAFKEAGQASFDTIAQKYEAKVSSAYFKYNDGKIDQSDLLKEPEIAAQTKGLQYPGSLAVINTPTESILIRLDSLEPVKISDQEKDQAKKMMIYTKSYIYKEGFVASLYRIAKLRNKIEIKNELLQTTKEV